MSPLLPLLDSQTERRTLTLGRVSSLPLRASDLPSNPTIFPTSLLASTATDFLSSIIKPRSICLVSYPPLTSASSRRVAHLFPLPSLPVVSSSPVTPVASLSSSKTGITLDFTTNQLGVQVYSAPGGGGNDRKRIHGGAEDGSGTYGKESKTPAPLSPTEASFNLALTRSLPPCFFEDAAYLGSSRPLFLFSHLLSVSPLRAHTDLTSPFSTRRISLPLRVVRSSRAGGRYRREGDVRHDPEGGRGVQQLRDV